MLLCDLRIRTRLGVHSSTLQRRTIKWRRWHLRHPRLRGKSFSVFLKVASLAPAGHWRTLWLLSSWSWIVHTSAAERRCWAVIKVFFASLKSWDISLLICCVNGLCCIDVLEADPGVLYSDLQWSRRVLLPCKESNESMNGVIQQMSFCFTNVDDKV